MDSQFKIDYGLLMQYREMLFRPWSGMPPFLTPVFFEKEVLIKYFHDSRYICQFHSETYSSILSENFSFLFGINPNFKIITWLGDIEELPKREQQYLLSFNIESDGNIDSEFFDAQIQVRYSGLIKEVEIILLKTKISQAFQSKYGFDLYGDIKPSVTDIIQMCSRYKRIIFNNEDDLKRFISEWNETLIEDLHGKKIKSVMKAKSIAYRDDIKSLKSLEIFLKDILGDQTNMIAPLFYLYDLRIWADHKDSSSKYDSVLNSLGLPSNATFSEIYDELITKIHFFMNEFLTILK